MGSRELVAGLEAVAHHLEHHAAQVHLHVDGVGDLYQINRQECCTK